MRDGARLRPTLTGSPRTDCSARHGAEVGREGLVTLEGGGGDPLSASVVEPFLGEFSEPSIGFRCARVLHLLPTCRGQSSTETAAMDRDREADQRGGQR